MEAYDSETAYAMYDRFMIDDADSNYTLTVGSYTGNAGDSIRASIRKENSNNMPFSTPDRDNDNAENEHYCAGVYKCGWWFNSCFSSNLNGLYGKTYNTWKALIWRSWRGKQSLKRSEMKIRKVDNLN